MRVYRPAPLRLDALEAKTTIRVSSALRTAECGVLGSGTWIGSILRWILCGAILDLHVWMEVAAEKTEDGSRYSFDVKA